MSERKDPHSKEPSYSVDDILSEYGSGKYGTAPQKVVPFPDERTPEPEDRPEPESQTDKPSDQAPGGASEKAGHSQSMAEIVPEGLGRHIAARLSTLLRRADHYADHMYDQAVYREDRLREDASYMPTTPNRTPTQYTCSTADAARAKASGK